MPVTSQNYTCSYSNPLILTSHNSINNNNNNNKKPPKPPKNQDDLMEPIITLQHYVNRFDNTITVRMVTQVGYHSWVGLGIDLSKKEAVADEEEEQSIMFPSMAVIGDQSRGVERYSLMSGKKDGHKVKKLQDTFGHLKKNGVLTQDVNEDGDETSTLEFTLDLVLYDENENDDKDDKEEKRRPKRPPIAATKTTDAPLVVAHEITSATTWIWAVGRQGNKWKGRHELYGSMTLNLFDGCELVVDVEQLEQNLTFSNTTAPSETPTTVPTAPPPPPPPTFTPTVRPTTTPTPAANTQTTVVVPLDDTDGILDDPPRTYHNNNRLTDNEKANLFDALAQGQDLYESLFYASTKTYWLVHGITLGLAWGVMAPLAVGAGLYRNHLLAKKNTHNKRDRPSNLLLWSRLYICWSLSVVLLTLVGYLVALLAARERPEDIRDDRSNSTSISSMEGRHAVVGMVILILLLVQGLCEYFRRCFPQPVVVEPSHTPTPTPTTNTNPNHPPTFMVVTADFPEIQQELPPPLPHGGESSIADTPSDISLLTASVYSERFSIKNISSVLGGADTDTDRDEYPDDENELLFVPTIERDVRSFPDGSFDYDDDGHGIFVDDDDQDIPFQQASANGQSRNDVDDAGIAEKRETPNNFPDISRQEGVGYSTATFFQCCCATLHRRLGACWNPFLMNLCLFTLGLAWFNCHTGMVLQFELANFQDTFFQSILLAIFWGLAVGSFVLVLVLYLVAAKSSGSSNRQ
ncbi:hypothetical protein IV203_018166 [Nitzschia inconspicua]|uniref:DOMON domain-containing protein n=1 Tax=Nitzschia inconspicua TaxID=303405 RepID=A0A9K3M0K2_9STRA|nr:hypothetical protein IV203_018166 [Nitzschia inconspicua]